MGDGAGAFLGGDLDLRLRDERPRDRRAEQIAALVHRVRAKHRKEEVAHELLAEVHDVDGRGTRAQRLVADRDELLALPDVCTERDDLAPVVLDDPAQDHRGVEPAGVREHDLAWIGHSSPSVSATMMAFCA